MRRNCSLSLSAVGLLGVTLLFFTLPALCQEARNNGEAYFPPENFVQIHPTLPNSRLNFDNDSQESCCAKDYDAAGAAIPASAVSVPSGAVGGAAITSGGSYHTVARSEFERSNPHYLEKSTPAELVTCDRFADLPETVVSGGMPVASFNDFTPSNSLPIESYSTNVSLRQSARYYSNPNMHVTSDFHIETAGGGSQIQLRDINSYSICMGRGNNVAMVVNSDGGSILAYNGNDHIYLAGNNTNMLTRTGAGEDTISLMQAQSNAAMRNPTRDELAAMGVTWTAYNIYKSALSGGAGTDTLVVTGTPVGTKWCHIGGYRLYGEYFYLVEFALPPSVTDGPRRQRISIGESVEFVVFKGKRYRLNEFLVHGAPMDTVASATYSNRAPVP